MTNDNTSRPPRLKRAIMSIAQMLVGIGLVCLLMHSINRGTSRVTLTVTQAVSAESDCTYERPDNAGTEKFRLPQAAVTTTEMQLLQTGKSEPALANTGRLVRISGQGPDTLMYTAYSKEAYGLQMLRNSFAGAAQRPGWMLGGVLAYLLCLVAVTFRWQVLLRAQAIHLRFPRAFALYFIGQFFSSFLPGAVSGDFIKMYYVTRESPDKKAEAATTVFIDRILGLLALILLSVVVMLLKLDFFLSDPRTRMALLFNLALLGGTALGMLLVFKRSLFERLGWFRRLEQHSKVGDIITRAYDAFHLCLSHPAVLAKAVGWSLVNHLSLVTGSYAIGQALNLPMRWIDYLTIFPVINTVAAIPVTPGGLGTRDSATVFLMGVFGVNDSDALTVSLLLYGTILLWSLVGGVVYMVFSARRNREAAEATSTGGAAGTA